FVVWTDDAYVGAKTATLAAKVPGYIATLEVEDNASVKAGDVIASIDAGDYTLAVDAARGKVATQQATVDRLGRQIAAQQAAVELSITQIRAPVDGVVGNRGIQVGDYVQPGTRLLSLVPLDGVYIDANFKETQLAGLKPGQHVSIAVDALPGAPIDGTVESV